ncbi:guanine deaminase [Congregibacter litoralis]|uniref:Guanine deaminase n=1 Tax=Congregibacter litoralis KT71 TaxID=314285 RepID=A4A382_9GAMM|nr:guanine deaminase [Congregibacter litoralis]EAQ99155.1 guanine deaminase [Congregibacter litoralis KT71]
MSRLFHRGQILHFLGDPSQGAEESYEYFPDGGLLIDDGKVIAVDHASVLLSSLPRNTEIREHPSALLVPGFIDTHIHYPQMDIIGAHGEQLLEWLDKYVFPTEAQFGDFAHAQAVAKRFLAELLRNGTTTALVFGTVHPESVDAFFGEAEALNLRMIAGKVMMDRNAPEFLRDTAASSYTQSKALIERWHGKGRLRYAVTPRFAPTSTPEQLKAAGRLLREHPGVYLHTHMSENLNEIAWVEELFPHLDHYLHSYDDAGLLGRRSVFAHCVHLSEAEWQRMAETQSNIAFCPTSNLFLGSGLFPLAKAESCGVHAGLGTDIGAGTSFSLLETMDEAYKVQQLQGHSLTPFKSFYLATLGGARALDLEAQLGNFLPGKEADFLVLDLAATPLLKQRMAHCENLFETLFVLSTLGDDRCIRETWIMGDCKYQRDTAADCTMQHDQQSQQSQERQTTQSAAQQGE